jgi:hypothetical protein
VKRTAVVAGRFYEAQKEALAAEVERLTPAGQSPGRIVERAIGAVCPHAGFFYSGAVAGAVYSAMAPADTFVLLGPNHTGIGFPISIMDEGIWETPTGDFDIDTALAKAIIDAGPLFTIDAAAHRFEHSLEVQLPFIARFFPNARIVPAAIMDASLQECRQAGLAIAHAIQTSGRAAGVTIIASSDMSHYVPDEVARTKDSLANERILALDPEGLYDVVRREGISMCGVLPTTVMLFAAISLGAGTARLVKYATSAEAGGDYGRVVGYSGILVT